MKAEGSTFSPFEVEVGQGQIMNWLRQDFDKICWRPFRIIATGPLTMWGCAIESKMQKKSQKSEE